MRVQWSTLSWSLAIWCANSVASESGGTFVAFNDLVPSEGGSSAGGGCSWNRFTHGRHWQSGGGILAAEPRVLLDAEGQDSPATVRFEEVTTHENTINNHIVPISLRRDSPAWREFADCLCPDAVCNEDSGECSCAALDGSLSYNDAPGWEFTYVFEGLDPRCEASVAFFVDRGGARHDADADYNERYSVFTLANYNSAKPSCRSALRRGNDGSSLVIRGGNNSAGHIAKWSKIRHDGTFSVSVSHDRSGSFAGLSPPPHAYKAYAGGAFKLSQVCEPVIETPEVAVTESLNLPGGLTVSMALTLGVGDPAAFVADESSPALVAQGIAAMAGVHTSDVTAELSVVWRRLSADRRLAGVVTVDTTIAVADVTAAEAVQAEVADVEPAALESSLNQVLLSSGKAEVSVVDIGVPVIGPPPADTSEPEDADDHGFLMPLVAVVGAVAAMLVLAVAAGIALTRSKGETGSCSAKVGTGGDSEANDDVHVIAKVTQGKDDDLNSEFSTITPSDNASDVSPCPSETPPAEV